MSDSSHEVSKHVRIYLIVGIALLVGTVLTVLMNAVHFDSMTVTIFIALFIACVKGFLVAGYFMHLMSEKKMIYGILGATVFFFAGMMYLIILARDSTPRGTIYIGSGQTFHSTGASTAH